MTPSLKTPRLLLRRLTGADAGDLLQTTGDPSVMRYWAPGPDVNEAQSAERIAQINEHWRRCGFGDWGVCEPLSGRLIGFCGLHHIVGMDEVNVGYALEPSRWRQGLGSELCRYLLRLGFEDLGLTEIVAVIDPRNMASRRLAEKCDLQFWKRFMWQANQRVAYRIGRAEWEQASHDAGRYSSSRT
jgi:RimJ/RimL family protein N-acetyltransferase